MKNLFGALFLVALVSLVGCKKEMKEATVQEANQSMADTMSADMPANAGADASTPPPASP